MKLLQKSKKHYKCYVTFKQKYKNEGDEGLIYTKICAVLVGTAASLLLIKSVKK